MVEPSSDVSANDDVVGLQDRLVMVVGNYGSGKTEVCVNLAIALARAGRTVQIADMDLVNPYFRCREAQWRMEAHGIRVVFPAGAHTWADLPIVLPEIRGMLHPPEGTLTLFDVGGDDAGAKVLASLRTSITDYELWQVINSKRPFTNDRNGCLAMQQAIEDASRLQITGLIANSHLIDQTTPEVVAEGWRLAQEVAETSDVPVRCVAVMDEFADAEELRGITAPRLRMKRHMVPPWIRAQGGSAVLPAAAPRPIGKPGEKRHGQD
jgi:hypothetical protein